MWHALTSASWATPPRRAFAIEATVRPLKLAERKRLAAALDLPTNVHKRLLDAPTVSAAFRAAAKRLHPDGGDKPDAKRWLAAVEACDKLLAEAKRRADADAASEAGGAARNIDGTRKIARGRERVELLQREKARKERAAGGFSHADLDGISNDWFYRTQQREQAGVARAQARARGAARVEVGAGATARFTTRRCRRRRESWCPRST